MPLVVIRTASARRAPVEKRARVPPFFLLLALPLAAQEPAADKASVDRLKAHLAELAGDAYEGRNAGYPGNDKAAEYIAAHFKKIGLRPAGQKDDKGNPTWFQSFTVDDRATRNVIGLAEGSDPALKSEYVIIGAHYDHVGKEGQSSQGRMPKVGVDPADKIWNGADDNGSGTVTVLEIAQAFMEGKIRTKRSVIFMTFSGEEWGLLGSKHYVQHPLFPLEKTVAMINLDMVGRNGTKPLEVMAILTSDGWADRRAAGTGVGTRPAGRSPEEATISRSRRRGFPRTPFTGFHADYHQDRSRGQGRLRPDGESRGSRFSAARVDGRRCCRAWNSSRSRSSASDRKSGPSAKKPRRAFRCQTGPGGTQDPEGPDDSRSGARAGLRVDVWSEFNGATFPVEGRPTSPSAKG